MCPLLLLSGFHPMLKHHHPLLHLSGDFSVWGTLGGVEYSC